MKYTSYNQSAGFSTIEILISFAVGIIFLTAAMMVAFSDPTLTKQISLNASYAAAVDVAHDGVGLATSTNKIGAMVTALANNWNASIDNDSDSIYNNAPEVIDIAPCLKEISNATTWNTLGNRSRSMTFGTALSNMDIAQGLGGDCNPFPPSESWRKPRIFSSHNFNPGKPVSIDVLQKIVYITDDKGKLQIYNAQNETFGSSIGFSITPYTDSENLILNDVDVVNIDNDKYALVVRDKKTSQFQVIKVTNPSTYSTSTAITLGGTTPPSGSFPHGWRVFYFDKIAYVTTRETAGYEFHTVSLATPMNPVEIGSGIEINGTINDLVITQITLNGVDYKLAFLATDRSVNEVMVLNVTNPNSPSLITSVDLPTNNDALSIQLLSNRLYIGRQKTNGGPELFVYRVTYGQSGGVPTVTLTEIGSGAEIDSDVTHMRVADKFAFIGNPLATVEFKVWNISKPEAGFSRIDTEPLNVSNKVFGIDYEFPYIYVASQANDALQILYSAP